MLLVYNDERKLFNYLFQLNSKKLRQRFRLCIEDDICCFQEKDNPKNYVTVVKKRTDPFLAPVNADFHFYRPAGSNNYPELLDVGKHLMNAFEQSYDWFLK